MKQICLCILCVLYIHNINAQAFNQDVINSSGQEFTNDNISITSNIGQCITSTVTANNLILTQGFLQPFSFDFLKDTDLDNGFDVYPSLTTGAAYYRFIDVNIVVKEVEVYDVLGRLVLKSSPFLNYVSLDNLANGAYWVHPIVEDKKFGYKKVIKVK